MFTSNRITTTTTTTMSSLVFVTSSSSSSTMTHPLRCRLRMRLCHALSDGSGVERALERSHAPVADVANGRDVGVVDEFAHGRRPAADDCLHMRACETDDDDDEGDEAKVTMPWCDARGAARNDDDDVASIVDEQRTSS